MLRVDAVPRATSSGLEGVSVADTRLSDVDGERGRLVIAGHDVEELAATATYEDAAALLLGLERSPGGPSRERLRAAIGAARVAAFERLERLGDAFDRPSGMDALRASIAHLDARGGTDEDDLASLAGASAVFAAAWARARAGAPPIPPDPSLGQAADYLRMVLGGPPPALAAQGLDTYFVTVSDHGMNASTFTARVIASTGSDVVSAVVGAIGALKGPLHGGAPGPVLDMLDAIGTPERAAAWLEGELEAGRRIMGMGHRIYRVRDPRAAALEAAALRLERGGLTTSRLSLARAVEEAAIGVLRVRHPNRPLLANVEFYTAVLLDAVGLPRELFSATFAVGRVLGWCAHVREQREVGRLIRPASRYVGPDPASAWNRRWSAPLRYNGRHGDQAAPGPGEGR